jgi:hypothetical protein
MIHLEFNNGTLKSFSIISCWLFLSLRFIHCYIPTATIITIIPHIIVFNYPSLAISPLTRLTTYELTFLIYMFGFVFLIDSMNPTLCILGSNTV